MLKLFVKEETELSVFLKIFLDTIKEYFLVLWLILLSLYDQKINPSTVEPLSGVESEEYKDLGFPSTYIINSLILRLNNTK